MNWFFEHREIPSEKNGIISVTRRRGSVTVMVDGCEQTGGEVHAMWESALGVIARFRGIQKTKSVLLLGLGGGGEVKNYYHAYPGASITAVEYDPAMIALADELHPWAPYPRPRIICEDAASAVPALAGRFDLIVLDLFKGPRPSALSENDSFLASLAEKLEDDGLLVVNVYRDEALMSRLKEKFLTLRTWRFSLNNLGLFSKHTMTEMISDGYLPMREWPDHNASPAAPSFFNPSSAGVKNSGAYWRLWPFSFELYKGDEEPDVSPLPQEKRAPVRVMMWQRLLRGDVPKGWRAFSEGPEYKIGFVRVSEGYEKKWSESARRSRKKWLSEEGTRFRIEDIGFDEYRKAYMKSALPVTMKSFTLDEARMRMKNPLTPVTFFGVRRIQDGKLVAGMATMQSASVSASYYHSGFYLPEVSDEPLMPGLFDHWFKTALAQGIRFIDFGNFWTPGKDNDWKGFSVFKAKFNPHYFFYPPRLFRFSLNGR